MKYKIFRYSKQKGTLEKNSVIKFSLNKIAPLSGNVIIF